MTYWLNPKISFKTFKLLNKKFYPKPDIIPMNGDKIIWQLLRDRKINIFIKNSADPLCLTLLPIPKNAKLIK